MTRFLNGSAAAVLAVVFVLAVAASVSASPIPSDVEDDQDQVSSYEVENWIMEKRPFCNAFAGCGRKRAELRVPYDRTLNSFPRLAQDTKMWDRLYAKLQQRYRNSPNYDSAKI